MNTIPTSLYATDRAQCPDCGAALKLKDQQAVVSCRYCGGEAVVERRLRTLWGCNLIFERFYPDRPVMGEIVLYRLLYMRGPVQAWAIKLAQGQMGVGYRYETPVLLRFIDDCAHERPELVPSIRKCFYNGWAEDEGEYLGRLAFIDELLTDDAKEMGIRAVDARTERMNVYREAKAALKERA